MGGQKLQLFLFQLRIPVLDDIHLRRTALSFRLFDTDEMLAVGHDSIVVAALLVAKPDRGRGEPAVNAPSVWTGTVINVLMPAMTPLRKNSSRPSPDHRGWIPPCDEICHLPGPDGSWRTYTSERPDSLDSYANHFPSGEMAPPYPTDFHCVPESSGAKNRITF